MSWIDIAIIGAVVLVGLIGLLKGVKKSALSLGAFVISFLVAFFLANVVAEALLGVDVIKGFVLGNGQEGGWSLASWIYNGRGGMQMDGESFLFLNFFKPMDDIVNSVTTAAPPEMGFAMYGAYVLFSAIIGVGLFIVARFLLIIPIAIIKSFLGGKGGVLGRLFGFLLGCVRGALWALAIMVVFTSVGGYTFASGINSVQAEFEHNAVICNRFYSAAYSIRNKLFLPNADTYGRVVELVYKTEPDDTENEKLTGNRLKLYIDISNLGYDGTPWTIDQNQCRSFNAEVGAERAGAEFQSVGFDAATNAILEYNKSVAAKIDNIEITISDDTLGTLCGLTNGDGNTLTAKTDALWAALRAYANSYTDPTEDDTDKKNSTLSTNYDNAVAALNELKAMYAPFDEAFGLTFPELTLPEKKVFA